MKWIIVVVLCLIGGLLWIGNYFYRFSLSRSFPREKAPQEKNENQEASPSINELEECLNRASFKQEVKIKAHDGLTLHGYQFNQIAPTHKWAIVIHGYTSEAKMMLYYAKHFFEAGYHVLVPNLRGHGESEGAYIGMGWHDRLDVMKWIDFILSQDDKAEIVPFGISMGGATVMMLAGEELPDQIKAIVEDCGYTSVYDEFSYQLKQMFNLTKYPIMPLASLVCQARAGYSFKEASSVAQLKKAKVPILFIHGDQDTFVPTSMLDVVYESCASPKQKLFVEGARHAEAAYVNPELYWSTIHEFLSKYITLSK